MSTLSCRDGVKLAGMQELVAVSQPLCSQLEGKATPLASGLRPPRKIFPLNRPQLLKPHYPRGAWSCTHVLHPILLLPDPRAGSCPPYLEDDPLLEQALLLSCHDKVVSVILVVDNVFQVNAW